MAVDLTQLKRINEASGIRSLKNKLVPLGGVLQGFWGSRVKYQEGAKDDNRDLLGLEDCHKISNRNLKCALGLDSKLRQGATCCSKQMKRNRYLRL